MIPSTKREDLENKLQRKIPIFQSFQEMIAYQKNATCDDRYSLLDLIVDYVSSKGEAITSAPMKVVHLRRLRRLGIISSEEGKANSRYGVGLHELRDTVRSVLEKAKSEKDWNVTSVEYWMGQVVDHLYYNKIWKIDPEYNLEQYRIAEKYLNIVSYREPIQKLVDERVKEEVERAKKDIKDIIQAELQGEMEKYGVRST